MTYPGESRAARWLATWQPILPLLAAELILWLGFGALLPVLPIYVTEHGVDLATLGLVVAAWPAARLMGEPFFGWLADRRSRRLLMTAGLLAAAVFSILPLVFVGPFAFIVLRALTGLSAALYDPAARGYLTDATPPERRGEAFGLYAAAQMGGLLLGPALGAFGADRFGGIGFVFVIAAVTSVAGAVAIAAALHDRPPRGVAPRGSLGGATEWATEPPLAAGRAMSDPDAGQPAAVGAPTSLWNRPLLGAIALHFGVFFTVGTNEVVWSLYLQSRGAGLDFIGLSFAVFGVPILLLSPIGGRMADRGGVILPIVAGSLASTAAMVLYPNVPFLVLTIPVILLESTAYAFSDPALFSVVARGSPVGRSSTAQGIFGAAGTLGFIVSSLAAGLLAASDLRAPFYMSGVAIMGGLLAWLVIAAPAVRGAVVPAAHDRVSAEPSER